MPSREFDITRGPLSIIARLRKALQNPQPLMKQLGALGVEESTMAFQEQKLGEHVWPAQYEGMEAPFIHIAGALTDFNAGRSTPKKRRFRDRPSLIDTQALMRSISFRTPSPFIAEWGTDRPYGVLHQKKGSTSRTPITAQGRAGISKWLFDARGRTRRGREGYVDKMAPLYYMSEWTQRVAHRPFLGVTPRLESKMREAIKRWYERRQQSGGGGKAAAP